MKRFLLLAAALFLVGCSSGSDLEAAQAEITALEEEIAEDQDTISDLRSQVQDLSASLSDLQIEYNQLQTIYQEKQTEVETSSAETVEYLCQNQIENMKYNSPSTAIAVLEGWFALQPDVQELQGTYSTQFWNDVKSRIHTIRYISAADNLSTTASFLIFFEEAGWQEGVLSLTDQCWLDYPE